MSHVEPPSTPVGTNRVSRFLTGRRTAWFVALIPLMLSLAVLATVGEGERNAKPTDSLPEGYDSTAAVALQQELPEEDSSVAIVLWTAAEGDLDEQQIGAVTEQTLALLAESGGSRPQDGPPQDATGGPPPGGTEGQPQGPVQLAEDGSAAFAVIPVEARTASDNADEVEELRERLEQDSPEGVDVAVTGPAGIQADIAKVFDGANFRLLATTAGVVALLLIITYRSPVLWIIPLVVIGIADRLAAIVATQVMERLGMSWDESTIGILSVLVFGAGTNYALLLISRYRDELKTTESRNHAMARALTRTSEAVFSSSSTVVLGVLTLLLSVFPATRGLGAATAMGIVIAATFAMVVLSATLVLFGRWVFWPQVPRVGDTTLVASERSVWRRVGDAVATRPRSFIVGTLTVLALMMVGLFQIQTGLRPADQFLETPEAISAGERLAESFPAGTTDPVQVLTREDPDEVLGTVEAIEGVTSARVTAEGGGVAQIDAVLEAAPGSDEAKDVVRDLREALAGLDETHVGGGDAEALDEADASERDRWLILPIILALVLGALILLLRSLVAPILLVTTVLLTFAAAMGTSWWAFRFLFDFPALDYGVPLLAFLFLVALGVDYNIFLVTRAREEAAEHGTRDGMLRALTATGGVITSAGILLAAVFAVLGVLPLVVLAQLGAIIFVGVLLDTLIVRTVLVPALAITLGDRFWWPRKVGPREDSGAGTTREPERQPATR